MGDNGNWKELLKTNWKQIRPEEVVETLNQWQKIKLFKWGKPIYIGMGTSHGWSGFLKIFICYCKKHDFLFLDYPQTHWLIVGSCRKCEEEWSKMNILSDAMKGVPDIDIPTLK